MILIVNVWRGGEMLMTASVTDAELIAELKLIAQAKGWRIEMKETPKPREVGHK